ncbi:unnamed protein product [Ostreobium quekettii]|uniref:uroporphyrinogen-III C-methyltransferase n=1 Tax=Ostreobium quekettii TaxID=121088 RepID=A0A8S1J8X1_9CHLO|nr:unnamed protein product [Ostreobium quekettii]|eukprot:evm.model.scf_63.18 EVM.evm.TU.scf_63.18   scf_63:129123-132078(+)
MLRPLAGPTMQTFVESDASIRIFLPIGAARRGAMPRANLPRPSRERNCSPLRALTGGPYNDDVGAGDVAGSAPDVDGMLRLVADRAARRGGTGVGRVYLVGTGPGDPGLLTMRAVQLMRSADVVLYDRLVSSDILQLVHPGARMVYVGKQRGFHTRTQDQIQELLEHFADAGALVLRLKGGDPYVFGRGGEEMGFLRERGIAVHCVPGITAASGISAELGIPLTHRGVATSVRFLTGHSQEGGREELDKTIAMSVDPMATLVVYMGLQTLPNLTTMLVEGGQDPRTPSVAVERGTTSDQRVVFSHLEELPAATTDASLKSPTLIIIGQVVALAPGWKSWIDTGVALQTGGNGSSNVLPTDYQDLLAPLDDVETETPADWEAH